MGRGFSPLCDAFAKKKLKRCLSKRYFKAGLFLATVVVVLCKCAESGCGILLSESLSAFAARCVTADMSFFKDSDFARGGGWYSGFHGYSIGVIG